MRLKPQLLPLESFSMRRYGLLALLLSTPVLAQVPAGNSAPQPVPYVDPIPAARDVPYPGTMQLDVDATDRMQRAGLVRA